MLTVEEIRTALQRDGHAEIEGHTLVSIQPGDVNLVLDIPAVGTPQYVYQCVVDALRRAARTDEIVITEEEPRLACALHLPQRREVEVSGEINHTPTVWGKYCCRKHAEVVAARVGPPTMLGGRPVWGYPREGVWAGIVDVGSAS